MKEKTKKTILLIAICLVTLMVLFIALKLNENRKQDERLPSNGLSKWCLFRRRYSAQAFAPLAKSAQALWKSAWFYLLFCASRATFMLSHVHLHKSKFSVFLF